MQKRTYNMFGFFKKNKKLNNLDAYGEAFLQEKFDTIGVVQRGSKNVCIAFSSRDTSKGSFTFYKTVAALDANIIFVNDYSNQWFLNGTPEFTTEAHFLSYLRFIIDKLKGHQGKLFTLGSSMGAYAALKYGATLGADRIFAMGPEIELCLPLGRSVTSLTHVEAGSGNISDLYYKNPNEVLIISGNNDIVDMYCLGLLHDKNVNLNINLVNNRTHVVANYLNATFGLDSIVRKFFEDGDLGFLQEAELCPVPDLKSALAMRVFNEQLARKEVRVTDKHILFALAKANPMWSMPQYFCALICEKENNQAGAECFYKSALAAQPILGRARLALAKLYMKQKNYGSVISLMSEQNFTMTENMEKILIQAKQKEGS